MTITSHLALWSHPWLLLDNHSFSFSWIQQDHHGDHCHFSLMMMSISQVENQRSITVLSLKKNGRNHYSDSCSLTFFSHQKRELEETNYSKRMHCPTSACLQVLPTLFFDLSVLIDRKFNMTMNSTVRKRCSVIHLCSSSCSGASSWLESSPNL